MRSALIIAPLVFSFITHVTFVEAGTSNIVSKCDKVEENSLSDKIDVFGLQLGDSWECAFKQTVEILKNIDDLLRLRAGEEWAIEDSSEEHCVSPDRAYANERLISSGMAPICGLGLEASRKVGLAFQSKRKFGLIMRVDEISGAIYAIGTSIEGKPVNEEECLHITDSIIKTTGNLGEPSRENIDNEHIYIGWDGPDYKVRLMVSNCRNLTYPASLSDVGGSLTLEALL